MERGKKDEDSGDGASYMHLDKSTVLQEARVFNETPINPRKCCALLTKILFLLYQGEHFQTNEATELFFSVTKLFQSPDVVLRRMVYLIIKELSTMAQDVIIVTSSLMKDMNAKSDVVYRPNAIRALCLITDPSMLQGIERFLKQAIVDKNPAVSSAAVVSALHLFNESREVVKRWGNEVQEAANSNAKGVMVQYHALGLLYQIRQHDRMAVTKLVQTLSRGSLKSPFAQCMLIRYACKVMEEEDGDTGRSMYDYLESCLRYKNDMVMFEAAKAICNLRNVTSKELLPAISVLQLFLSSSKPTLRFAAIRTLNLVALKHPLTVSTCNLDMENLVADSNRSIATFAITTLLKTGNEASVDRLMKSISGFMNEISDEFKVIVVDAIRSLCLKFPNKHSIMLNFLASALKDQGGHDFKRAIVDSLFDLVNHIPEAKDAALGHLCEFIEDCDFTDLSVRILHLLGAEGPKTQHPSKYIRYIYNRVILEKATVRAAAVSSLAKFGAALEDMRPSITVLLKRCLSDEDDDVRDRATFCVKMFENPALGKAYIVSDSTFSFAHLERLLVSYLSDPNGLSKPFEFGLVPVLSREQELADIKSAKVTLAEEAVLQGSGSFASKPVVANTSSGADGASAAAKGSSKDAYVEALAKIPQFTSFGALLKSSKAVPLTEAETEYVVSAVKHVFLQHIVFQFNCQNTLNDQILENVTVSMETDNDELDPIMAVPAKQLRIDQPGVVYVAYSRPANSFASATFNNTLKFVVKDCDPQTMVPDDEGYDDEYVLETLDLVIGDYISPALPNPQNDFKSAWESMGDSDEIIETYSLTALNSLQAAVKSVINVLGMFVCDNTGTVSKERASSHTLLLSGNVIPGTKCLVRARMAFEAASGVTLELAVRSENRQVSELVANAIN